MGNKTVMINANAKSSNYRWYNSTSFIKEKQIETNLTWEPFSINLCCQLESKYKKTDYYEKDDLVFLFSSDNTETNLLLQKSNVWEHKKIMRTDNIDNIQVYRKARKQILNLEKTMQFNQFALALSQQMAYAYYSNIFKYTTYDTNDQLVNQFVNYSTVLDLKFYQYLQKDYAQYLFNTYGSKNESFYFDSIKNILRQNFLKVKELEQYVKVFIDNITRDNFFLIIIEMFNEEGPLYSKIIQFQSNKTYEFNTDYTMYYLCLLFTLNELNAKGQRAIKVIYFDTVLCANELLKHIQSNYFNKDDIFYLPELLIASKEKINSNAKVQIEIFTQPETNAFPFLQLDSYDVSDYSLYHERDIILRPGSALRCLGLKQNKTLNEAIIIQFELIEDIICSQTPFLSLNDKKKLSIYDDISTITNEESTTVAYAKVRQRKINYLKNRLTYCLALNFYDNEIGDEGIEIVSTCFQKMKKLRWLNFTGNEIGESGILKFALYTNYLPSLSYLNLSFNLITDTALEAIKFIDLKSLKYLILKENQISFNGMIYLSTQLIYLTQLIELDLYNNHIEDKGLISLCKQFNILKDLQRLDLYNIRCTDESMIVFLKEWQSLESLTYLNLKQNSFGNNKDVTDLLINTILSMNYLIYFNISQNNIPLSIMKKISNVLSMSKHKLTFVLETYEFVSIDNIVDNASYYDVKDSLNNCNLQCKGIKCNNINSKPFKSLDEQLDKKVKIKGNNYSKAVITESNIELFISNIMQYLQLKTLSFEDCNIPISIAKRFSFIFKSLPNIIELNLSFCHLTDQSLPLIFNKVNVLSHLKTLNMKSNYLGEKGMQVFSPLITKLSRLETLDLSWNSINSQGIIFFSQYQSYLINLRFLELYSNNINDDGMISFCETVISLNKLESLNLGKNQISSKSISLLCKCFARLTSLTDLNLYDNIIGNNGIKVFFQYFNNIVQLKTFDLRNNCLSEKMKQYVMEQGIPRGFKLE